MVEIMCQKTTDYLEYTRSCAALRAADLGLSGNALRVIQLKVIIFRDLRGVTTDLHDTA